jgi:hypothetical protein
VAKSYNLEESNIQERKPTKSTFTGYLAMLEFHKMKTLINQPRSAITNAEFADLHPRLSTFTCRISKTTHLQSRRHTNRSYQGIKQS